MSSQRALSRSTSRVSSSSLAPSAAVRTMTPAEDGTHSLRSVLSRLRSVSGSLREMPDVVPSGTYTRNRPGRLIWLVRRAPLWPTGSLVTCTRTVWPEDSTDSILRGLPSLWPRADQLTSPAYSTALRPLPMSMKAASIEGSTFWTRPR
jgi:hypothetical protein